jgi:hypothetical protein
MTGRGAWMNTHVRTGDYFPLGFPSVTKSGTVFEAPLQLLNLRTCSTFSSAKFYFTSLYLACLCALREYVNSKDDYMRQRRCSPSLSVKILVDLIHWAKSVRPQYASYSSFNRWT